MAADKTAVFFKLAEIEQQITHAGRQNPAGSAARQVGVEGMAVEHAAAIILDQLAHRDPSRRHLDARVLDPPGHRIAAKPGMTVLALIVEPIRPLLDDVADPEKGLDIVDQGWSAEETYLSDIGRPVTRVTAFTLNRLDHRRFLTADIRSGAAPQMNPGVCDQALGFQPGNFQIQQRANLGILVAEIEITILRPNQPGGDQHSLQGAMRVALQIIAILESTGFPLIGIDRQRLASLDSAHQGPLPWCRKPGTTKTTQCRFSKTFQNLFGRALA